MRGIVPYLDFLFALENMESEFFPKDKVEYTIIN